MGLMMVDVCWYGLFSLGGIRSAVGCGHMLDGNLHPVPVMDPEAPLLLHSFPIVVG